MKAAEFVVIGSDAFAAEIVGYVNSALTRPILAPQILDATILAKERTPEAFVHDREKLVRDLCSAHLAAIDLSLGGVAYYALGVREALTSGITLACYSGAEPDWPLRTLKPTFVDMSGANVDELKKILLPLNQSAARRWTNSVRAAQAVNVGERPLILKCEGTLDGSVDPHLNRETRWRRKGATGGAAIGMRFGDANGVKDVAVWVNSENVNMQMAREVERSLSALIRHLGSRKTGPDGADTEDAIYLELARAMGSRSRLQAGEVLMTRAPDRTPLRRDKNVEAVAHVASVEPAGQGKLYRPAGDMGECVKNTLDRVYTYAEDQELTGKIKSILLPLFAAGDGGLPAPVAAAQMVGAIDAWLSGSGKAQKHFETIFFLARDARTRDAIVRALDAYDFVPYQVTPST